MIDQQTSTVFGVILKFQSCTRSEIHLDHVGEIEGVTRQRQQTGNPLKKSHLSNSSPAFDHLFDANRNMAQLTTPLFKRNDSVKNFRKAGDDSVVKKIG